MPTEFSENVCDCVSIVSSKVSFDDDSYRTTINIVLTYGSGSTPSKKCRDISHITLSLTPDDDADMFVTGQDKITGVNTDNSITLNESDIDELQSVEPEYVGDNSPNGIKWDNVPSNAFSDGKEVTITVSHHGQPKAGYFIFIKAGTEYCMIKCEDVEPTTTEQVTTSTTEQVTTSTTELQCNDHKEHFFCDDGCEPLFCINQYYSTCDKDSSYICNECDYVFDVKCDNMNALFQELCISLYTHGSDIAKNSQKILAMNIEELKSCLNGGVSTIRYTRNGENKLIDECVEPEPEPDGVFAFPDKVKNRKLIKRCTPFDRLIRVFMHRCFNLPLPGQQVADYDKAAKIVASMLCEKQHAHTVPTDYNGYIDIYHKALTEGITNATNETVKRGKLIEAIRQKYIKKFINEKSIDDELDKSCIDVDMSDAVLIYCFRYRSILDGNCNKNQPLTDSFDNSCANSNANNDDGVIICVRISQ